MYAPAQMNKAVVVIGKLFVLIASCVAMLTSHALLAHAQTATTSPQAAPAQTTHGKSIVPAKPVTPQLAQKQEAKPTWQELTPAQQQSLKPLAANWVTIGEGQKRKWLAISKNYPALPLVEQAKLHSRMTEWVSLSPQQRTQARLNFAETKKLTSGEKVETWKAYQALSAEDKLKLAANATPTPSGAAAAVKPVAPQKLAAVPVTRQGAKHSADIASSTRTHAVDNNTLLPKPSAFAEPAPVQKN